MAFSGDIFDIMGPVMVGPSSSHTAGAARLGRLARLLLGEEPKSARFYLHGSFYLTLNGHGTDLALVAGLLGIRQDDPKIRESFNIAEKQGLEYSFERITIDGAHPNTVKVEAEGISGARIDMQGSSVGGGSIMLSGIDEFPVELSCAYPALIIFNKDKPGVVADVTREIARHSINIAFMRVTRSDEGAACTIIECDGAIPPAIMAAVMNIDGVDGVRLIERLE